MLSWYADTLLEMAIIHCLVLTLQTDRRPGEESDANSSRGTSTDGESEGTDRGANDARGSWNQKNNIGHGFRRYAGRNNPSMESSVDTDDISNPPGLLTFEYFERELPFHREPLADKASLLL